MPHEQNRPGSPSAPPARPPAGPGKEANRRDLSEVQPQGTFAPKGLPHGRRKVVEGGQDAAPIPRRRRPPPRGGGGLAGGGGAPTPALGEMLGQMPTRKPDVPVTRRLQPNRNEPPDLIHVLASLPGASARLKSLSKDLESQRPPPGIVSIQNG